MQIPTTFNIPEMMMEQIEQNTKMLTTIVKGQTVYAAALVAIPLYFHALGKLYKRFGKFLISNIPAMLKIVAAKRLYIAVAGTLITSIDNMNDIIRHMENPLVYTGARIAADQLVKFNSIFMVWGENSYIVRSIKIMAFGAVAGPTYAAINKIIEAVNETITLLRSPVKYWIAKLRLKAQLSFIKYTLVSFINLASDKTIAKLTIKDIVGVYKKYIKLMMVFQPFIMVLKVVTNKMMPLLLKYGLIRYKLAFMRVGLLENLVCRIIDFLNSATIQNFKIIKGLKTAAKLAIMSMCIYIIASALTFVGVVGPFVVLGGLVIFAVCGIFTKLFEWLGAKKIKQKPVKLFTTILLALLSAWVAAKVTEELRRLGIPIVAGLAILGAICIFTISLIFMGLFKILVRKRMGEDRQKLLKTFVDTIAVFITAWAGAKLAETIAPIGPQIHWVLIGAVTISIMSLMFLRLFMKISLKLKGKSLKNIKTLMDVLSTFITAWAGAKLAETIAPVGKRAKWVLIGALVVSSVILIFTSTFVLISKMLNDKKDKMKLLRLSISLYAMSLAIVFMTINLAFAAVFAPLALATMTVVLVIAGMVALVGLMHKPVKRGSIAMMMMGFAMQTLASPILVFGISAALVAIACGSVDMVITTVLAVIVVLYAFVGLAALCGYLMEKGYFVSGLIALIGLGIAMSLMTLPLLLMASALSIISKLDIKENALADIFRCFVAGVKVFFEDGNLMIMNPFMLGYIMSSMLELAIIISFVGCMADTLQHIAQLMIPTEFDENGKGKKFVRMSKQDFIDAADNATTIIGFVSGLFTSETLKIGNETIKNPVKDMLNTPITLVVKRSFRRLRTIVGYIGEMADTLQHIASLNMPISWTADGKPNKFVSMKQENFMDAANNAAAIISFFTLMFTKSTKIKINGGEVMIPKVNIPFIPLMLKISMRRIRTIVGYIGDMADTVQKISSLSIPDEWNKDGKPIHYRQLNNEDFVNAGNNTDKIISCLVDNAKKIISDDKIFDALSSWDMEDAMNNLKTLMEPVSACADMIVKFATLQVPVVENGQIKKDSKGNVVYRVFNDSDFKRAGTFAYSIARKTIEIGATAAELLLNAGMGGIPGIPNVFGGNPMEDALENLKNLMTPISMMVDTICKLATLQVPASNPDGTIKTDGKGNIVYRLISDADFKSADKAVARILTGDSDWKPGQAVSGGLIGIGKLAGDMLTEALEDNNTRDSFTNLGILMDPLSKMVDIVIKLASSQIPDGFDKDGKAIGYHTIKDTDIDLAWQTTRMIAAGMIQIGLTAGRLLTEALEDNNSRDAFTNLGILMDPISSMVDIVIKLASGSMPTGFDKNGKATGFDKINKDAINRATQNVRDILGGIMNIFVNDDGSPSNNMFLIQTIYKQSDIINDSMATVSSMYTDFGNIAEIIATKQLDKPKLFDSVSGTVSGLVSVMNTFKDVEDVSLYKFQAFSRSIVNMSNANTVGIDKVSTNLKGFIKQINDTDVNKLRNTADALRAIADISKSIKGDFNGLAKTINEKLLTVLEQLNESLTKVGDKITGLGNINVNSGNNSNSENISDMMDNPAKKTDDKDKNKPITKKDLEDIISDIALISSSIQKLTGCIDTYGSHKALNTILYEP